MIDIIAEHGMIGLVGVLFAGQTELAKSTWTRDE